MSDLILSASGVRKRFDGRDILKGVSLSLQKGDVVAIIGRSGSGKSTFLRCLAELERIDAGRIEIGGEAMVDTEKKGYEPESRLRVIRRRMGYVFQDFNLFPHFTVLRNITDAQRCVLAAAARRQSSVRGRCLPAWGCPTRPIPTRCFLSGGQQQRVAIARALALDPDILCFDEPTSALDPELTQEVLSVIRDLAAEGHTMIVVTHEMSFAREVAGRILYMAEGEILCEGTPAQVFADARVRAFAGDDA